MSEYIVIDTRVIPLDDLGISLQAKLNEYAKLGYRLLSHEDFIIIMEKDDSGPVRIKERA